MTDIDNLDLEVVSNLLWTCTHLSIEIRPCSVTVIELQFTDYHMYLGHVIKCIWAIL